MNSQEFQIFFNNRANQTSTIDADAQAHLETCTACCDFAREQNLTTCLRRVAASTAALQASHEVESALRQAFRQHIANADSPRALITSPIQDETEYVTAHILNEGSAAYAASDVESEPDTANQSHKTVGIHHLIAAQTANAWRVRPGGLAYIILVFCLVTVGVLAARWQPSESINQQTAYDTASPRSQDALPSFSSRVTSTEEVALQTPVTTDDEAPKAFAHGIMQPASFTPAPRPARRPRARLNDRNLRGAKLAAPKDQIENERIATQFFPLDDSLTPIESGQLVSVEMPRSALASFGLPVSVERSNELVKAEVVVGTDGIARAIRFVR